MNKKAQLGDHTMFPMFLIFIIIIAVGIAIGINSFFGAKYDFRHIDSEILNNILKECLLNNNLNLSDAKEIQETCKVNIQIIQDEMLFIIKQEEKQVLKLGRGDETSCELAEKNENFPKCTISEITLSNKKAKIINGSSQWSKQKLAGTNTAEEAAR